MTWLQLAAITIDAEKAEETPEGYLIVPATLARVGVLEYATPSGSRRRVLRSERSVFGDMDRLGVVPVTALHPRHNSGDAVAVSGANYRAVTVGHVLGGSQRRDGDYLRAKLVIQDAATVAAIRRRELPEVSMGYHPVIVERAGTHPRDSHYDAVQTEATYNHVALVPSGRAGPSVRLHIDAGDARLSAPSAPAPLDSYSDARRAQIARLEGRPEPARVTADHALRVDFYSDARRAQIERLEGRR